LELESEVQKEIEEENEEVFAEEENALETDEGVGEKILMSELIEEETTNVLEYDEKVIEEEKPATLPVQSVSTESLFLPTRLPLLGVGVLLSCLLLLRPPVVAGSILTALALSALRRATAPLLEMKWTRRVESVGDESPLMTPRDEEE